MTAPLIYPLGESALVCESPPPATIECQARVLAVARQARDWPHVVDVVPGMNNLTVIFDPLQADVAQLHEALALAWDRAAGERRIEGRTVVVPVRYGGIDGPDLAVVAEHAGMSVEEVVSLHSRAEYTVFFVGFQPGFAYMGGLDARLHTPRRDNPRVKVPAGSVGIGGAQTGVYPASSPGGWQLIGRTGERLFDPSRESPTSLVPGDRVRFEPVGEIAC